MTQVTPPGWYADPGQTSDGPRTERWWDGSAWTNQTRPVQEIVGWGPTGYPPGPGGRPPRSRTALGALVALVVLAGIGGGVYALTGHDNDNRTSSPTSPSPSSEAGGNGAPEAPGSPGVPGAPDAPGAPDGPVPSAPPAEDGFATDMASGVSIPIPDGWEGQSGVVGAEVTTGTYTCPGDASQTCLRGGAFSQPARFLKLKQSTARAAAEADISKNAEDSYGGKVYGPISSHTQLAARAVTVAGGQGYLVRWKVITSKGDDGYVESLVFPSPARKRDLVVVRFAIDENDKAPKLATMDDITKGIKKAAGGAGGGDGKQV